MPDLLDTLDWKPWPKDPAWVYADISGVARVSRKAGMTGNGARYFVRALDDGGELGSWHYTNVERTEAARILDNAIREMSLQAES
jgi:hypothetical protein